MKVNKVELAEKINALESLDNETKSQLLELLHERKRYGLVWENHKEDVEERLRSELPVLREVKDKFIPSDDPDAPNHILIEGDNHDALTALSYTHEGKIDVIYIDPPYNTGNKDFVYNDAFVDSEDEYRHSKWLSFMAKRLKIAKRLLSDKGVIFISIDDNEQAALKLLCDEVFGGDKFVGNVIWEKVDSPRMDVSGFSVRHDYILVYGNSNFLLKRLPINAIPEHYNRTDELGRRYYTKPMRIMGGHTSESLFYPLVAPDGTEVYPYDKKGEKSGWRWSLRKVNEESDRIDWVKGKNGWNPYFRIYAENMRDMPVETIWTFKEVGSNRTAKNALNDLLGDNAFSYPKPIGLIKRIEQIGGDKNATILDFFAGSGTTLHATMQLNTDGGHRQCIMVTNNENNICEEVTYERNKRVINGYTTPKGEKIEGLHNNTLRYYRTDFVGRENTLQNRRKLVYLATDLLCIKENCYNEQPCIDKQARFFTNKDKRLIILYNPDFIPELVEFISCLPQGEKINVYVFADGAYPYTDDFSEVLDKIELCAIPDAILNAMRRVLPKKKVKTLDTINPDKSMQAEIQQALENASVNDYKKTEIW